MYLCAHTCKRTYAQEFSILSLRPQTCALLKMQKFWRQNAMPAKPVACHSSFNTFIAFLTANLFLFYLYLLLHVLTYSRMRACHKNGGALSPHCAHGSALWFASWVDFCGRVRTKTGRGSSQSLYDLLDLIFIFYLHECVLFIFRCSSADYVSARRSRFLFFNDLKYFMCVTYVHIIYVYVCGYKAICI